MSLSCALYEEEKGGSFSFEEEKEPKETSKLNNVY